MLGIKLEIIILKKSIQSLLFQSTNYLIGQVIQITPCKWLLIREYRIDFYSEVMFCCRNKIPTTVFGSNLSWYSFFKTFRCFQPYLSLNLFRSIFQINLRRTDGYWGHTSRCNMVISRAPNSHWVFIGPIKWNCFLSVGLLIAVYGDIVVLIA